jgi:hypothetical protein
MEGHLVRRMPYRFQLEHLEDRLTPSAPGLFASAFSYHSESLHVDWSARVNVTIVNFSTTFQTPGMIQFNLDVSLPVFSFVEFGSQPSVFAPSTSLFGSPTGLLGSSSGLLGTQMTGAFGTATQADSGLAQTASITAATPSTVSASQGASPARQPSVVNTPARTPVVVVPPAQVVQTTANPTSSTVQTSAQTANAVAAFSVVPVRAASATASGAADTTASELLRVLPLETPLGAPAVNPLAVTNPILSTPPKLTPLPQSGGGDSAQTDELPKPVPVERGVPEQQEAQELLDLFEAGLSSAFVPDNSDEAAGALALVGGFEAPSARSEVQLLLFGLVAASTIGVAHRRNRIEESERALQEAACWLPRPFLK